MRSIYLKTALAATILLSACGEKAPTGSGIDASKAALVNGANAGMDNGDATAAKAVKSSGTVAAIDQAAGKITLDHQPIPEVGWPAMTMAFTAKPEVLGALAVGDRVTFDANIGGNQGEVTTIKKK